MLQEIESEKQVIETYEINNKKYTVITKCVDNKSTDELYHIVCKYIVDKLKERVYTSKKEVLK